MAAKESERAEAASLLERRMTQMEAILAARRAVQQEPTAQTETEAAREGGGEMRFQVIPSTCSMARVAAIARPWTC